MVTKAQLIARFPLPRPHAFMTVPQIFHYTVISTTRIFCKSYYFVMWFVSAFSQGFQL